ncbi:unnamed protein product [Peronospora destructor]|uniref:Uncharacterized protein n=1 Tax=Peronospora destructor TaxID=86335 RepID=A0AAV0UQT5_9STRA|nr:unnamed protein product [Peronospora destructor]
MSRMNANEEGCDFRVNCVEFNTEQVGAGSTWACSLRWYLYISNDAKMHLSHSKTLRGVDDGILEKTVEKTMDKVFRNLVDKNGNGHG